MLMGLEMHRFPSRFWFVFRDSTLPESRLLDFLFIGGAGSILVVELRLLQSVSSPSSVELKDDESEVCSDRKLWRASLGGTAGAVLGCVSTPKEPTDPTQGLDCKSAEVSRVPFLFDLMLGTTLARSGCSIE